MKPKPTRPIAGAEKRTPKAPKPYSVDTQYGTMQATKHVFNGRTYVQMELDTPRLESVGELLIESDIFSAVKRSADGSVDIDAGAVVSHLIRKRMIRSFFCIVLRHDDGTVCSPEEFDGKASEFLTFTAEVFQSFFTLNPDALQSIGTLLATTLGVGAGGGRLIAMLLAGKN